jgi:hypothetical protein
MEPTEYKELTEAQRHDAVTALGLSLSATCTDKGDVNSPSVWGVNLCRQGRNYSTEYTMGAAYRKYRALGMGFPEPWQSKPIKGGESRPIPPTQMDVLACLVMDAGCVRHGQSLSDFGHDLGYSDLQKGLDAYNGCLESWRGLVRLGLDLDALDTIFQDY